MKSVFFSFFLVVLFGVQSAVATVIQSLKTLKHPAQVLFPSTTSLKRAMLRIMVMS